ncbi:MAG TPA: hypothetical protein VKV05_02955 [Terriglobales bacterium]|nr:hypothetical protein [Terriglobales bacterium]
MRASTATRVGDDQQLLDTIYAVKKSFGTKCHKYAGALTVECLRQAFAEHGIPTSQRDVFIKGVPVEIDLVVPKTTARPDYGICYEADDVLAALEVKSYGAFGQGAAERIRACFKEILRSNPSIWCAYVTLTERKNYKYAVNCSNLEFPAFTLFWHSGPEVNPQFSSTGQWAHLISELKKLPMRPRDVGTYCSTEVTSS